MSTTTAGRRAGGRRSQPRHVVAHLFLLALVIYFLIPVWWLFVASTKNAEGLFSGTGALWFDGFHLFENIRALLTHNNGEFVRWLGHSLLYALSGGIGSTVIAVLAGDGALVIPTFIMLSNLELTDTVWAVIRPSPLSPFGVYLMRGYTSAAVPDELIDAARVDGAGELRTFFQVALPMLRPAVVIRS